MFAYLVLYLVYIVWGQLIVAWTRLGVSLKLVNTVSRCSAVLQRLSYDFTYTSI